MDGPWWGEHASQRRQLLRNPYEAAATLRRMSRILVVDDEAAVREALERALRFEGYEVELAEDGYEALLAVAESPPEAIVLDVMMPRVEGIEMCRRLRAATIAPRFDVDGTRRGEGPGRWPRRRSGRLPSLPARLTTGTSSSTHPASPETKPDARSSSSHEHGWASN